MDLGTQAKAVSAPNNWTYVEMPNFSYGDETPVMAIADNHIFFLGIPSNSAGEANIFVIHCTWLDSGSDLGSIPVLTYMLYRFRRSFQTPICSRRCKSSRQGRR